MKMGGKWERLRGRLPLIRLAAETHLATFSRKGRRKTDTSVLSSFGNSSQSEPVGLNLKWR
jgi:hypothetical protein